MILLDLGDFYRTYRKNFSLAYDLYRRAQEQNSRDETAYRRLNDICRRLGRADEAGEWSAHWAQVKTTKGRVDGRGHDSDNSCKIVVALRRIYPYVLRIEGLLVVVGRQYV